MQSCLVKRHKILTIQTNVTVVNWSIISNRWTPTYVWISYIFQYLLHCHMADYSQTFKCSVSFFCCSTVLCNFSFCSFISLISFISLMFSLSFSSHLSCTSKQSLLNPKSGRYSEGRVWRHGERATLTFMLTASCCCFSNKPLRVSFSSIIRSSSRCSSAFSWTFCSTCSCTQADTPPCFIDFSPSLTCTSTFVCRCCELAVLVAHLRRDHQQVVVLADTL